jgi:uncharacterized repeat protein (TIGR01451 family)
VLVVGGVLAPLALPGLSLAPWLLLVVAGGSLLVGGRALYGRIETGVSVRAFPPVEWRSVVRRTGAPFETAAREADAGESWQQSRGRMQVVRRLEPLVRSVVGEREGWTEGEATERLEGGTWTDDETAAGLFETASESGVPARLLGRTPSIRAQASAVVGELAETVLGERSGSDRWLSRVRTPTGSRRWWSGRWQTGRWRGIGGLGLVALAGATLSQQPALVLVAATLLGLAGYARLGEPVTPTLAVRRTLGTETPSPGEAVTVTLTVRNEGEGLVPDLRVVDGVPDELAVVTGSPRLATALAPGESVTVEYDVLAVYGDHDFSAAYVATRDPSGGHERTLTVEGPTTTLSCEAATVQESIPLHPQTSGVVGRVESDTGGSGHEFHAVREYRRGDPAQRVDWNRLARTGDLATLQFREEHAATVVVVVDTRERSARAPRRDALSAVDRGLAGAAQVTASLLADGDRVGFATVGLDFTWVGPGAGGDHRDRLRATLSRGLDPGGADDTFGVDRYVRRLRRRLPSDAQVVLFSPLLDGESVALARRLHAHGHRVTLFSPDPTTRGSVGGTLATVERTRATRELRRGRIPVVDWGQDERLAVAVERAKRRWRR